jgi:hypothetical protein
MEGMEKTMEKYISPSNSSNDCPVFPLHNDQDAIGNPTFRLYTFPYCLAKPPFSDANLSASNLIIYTASQFIKTNRLIL